jgi:uncharacterized membrane protein YoaK (UPF0700 family)
MLGAHVASSPLRLLLEYVILTVMMPALAGVVNACGFIEVGMYTSHMTGHVARVGVDLYGGHFGNALGEALLAVTFMLGAMGSTVLIEVARRRDRPRYAIGLLLQAALFVVFAFHVDPHGTDEPIYVIACTLCLAMGLQNAITAESAAAVFRTTHLTGILTDLGRELARVVTRGGPPIDSSFVPHPISARLGVHLTVLLAFLMGAALGPMLLRVFGAHALALPGILLVGLAVYDLAYGMDTQHAEVARARAARHLHP